MKMMSGNFEEAVEAIEQAFDGRHYYGGQTKARLLKPHCDCRQSNRALGITTNPYRFDNSVSNPEIPWNMVPTKAKANGTCAYCGYLVVMKEEAHDESN